jgi:Fur family ferric uptake transcriptional regulator
MEEDLLDELELKVEQQYAFSITNHTLQFYGRCSNCRN